MIRLLILVRHIGASAFLIPSTKVKQEAEPYGIRQRVPVHSISRGEQVGKIETENIVIDAYTQGKITSFAHSLAVAVIACSQGKLVIVHIFSACCIR